MKQCLSILKKLKLVLFSNESSGRSYRSVLVMGPFNIFLLCHIDSLLLLYPSNIYTNFITVIF